MYFILEIAVPCPLRQTFDYLGSETDLPWQLGSRVVVPFGSREVIGIICGIKQQDSAPEKLKTIKAGSALKFGYLAEGKAHFYLRNDSINEWDTAAGHALLNAAGGHLLTWPAGEFMLYNKKEMRNPAFVACGNKELLEFFKAKFTL